MHTDSRVPKAVFLNQGSTFNSVIPTTTSDWLKFVTLAVASNHTYCFFQSIVITLL